MAESNRPEVWLVRHGQTEWSRDGKHTSSTDLPLTPAGEEAARTLADRLGGVDFDMVLSSPRQRAHVTARLAGFHDVRIDDDLREWEYGDDEGISTATIREERSGWLIWRDGPKNGETTHEVGARADRLVARLRAEAASRILLFGHGHFSRVMGARWCDLPVSAGAHLLLGTATVSVLGWYREIPAISRWNC